MDSKKWYLSKTLWFNVLALITAVAQYYGFANFTPDPNMGAYAIALVAVVNAVLRLVTKKPVTLGHGFSSTRRQ